MTNNLRALYGFRRCPHAIRARMALIYAGISVEIQEVELMNKPEHLLAIYILNFIPLANLFISG